MIRPRVNSTGSSVAGSGGRLFLRSPTLTASNFAALESTELKFLALKDLNLLKTVSKFQEDRSILKVGFALSKWPHFISYRGSCQNRSDQHCNLANPYFHRQLFEFLSAKLFYLVPYLNIVDISYEFLEYCWALCKIAEYCQSLPLISW